MTEVLLNWDVQTFLWINVELANDWFDAILPLLRDKLFWVPLYVFILSIVFFNSRWRQSLLVILILAGTMAISDTISSKIIKPTIERVRPCNNPELEGFMIERVRCGGGYSFTSSHATNHFTLSVFLFYLFVGLGIWRWLFILWAASIAYAQIYVGVHYPLDVMFGAFNGTLIGLLGSFIYLRSRKHQREKGIEGA